MLLLSDFAKLNDDELKTIAGWHRKTGDEQELISWFSSNYNCPTICVTRGPNGAILFIQNKFYSHAGFTVTAMDTVGAGDSFLAGLISAFAKDLPPEEALEKACATGAFIATQNGAVPNYSEKNIEKIIKDQSL